MALEKPTKLREFCLSYLMAMLFGDDVVECGWICARGLHGNGDGGNTAVTMGKPR